MKERTRKVKTVLAFRELSPWGQTQRMNPALSHPWLVRPRFSETVRQKDTGSDGETQEGFLEEVRTLCFHSSRIQRVFRICNNCSSHQLCVRVCAWRFMLLR